ncbi:hypothetical protein BH10PSE1_BH10PSE1_02920 [soil metagenome]
MTDTYRIRSPETWDRAREAYLAGETAESVCSRFDLSLRTFRACAADQSWRRCDQPDPEPFEVEADAELDDEVSDADLRRLARARMALAARQGLVGEALRWARLGEIIDRQAQAEARLQRELAREQARSDREDNARANTLLRDVTAGARSIEASVRAVVAGDRVSDSLHDLHDLHPVSEGAEDEARLNRAQRRQSLKRTRKRR